MPKMEIPRDMTGAYRFRRTLFGRYVLQVQIRDGLDSDYSTICGEEIYHTSWVDAKHKHVMSLDLESNSFAGLYKGFV